MLSLVAKLPFLGSSQAEGLSQEVPGHKPRLESGAEAGYLAVSRCLFCGVEVAQVSFLVSRSLSWYRNSALCCSSSRSSSSWNQPVRALLGLDILQIGGQKDLDTEEKIKKSRCSKEDISIPSKRVTPF